MRLLLASHADPTIHSKSGDTVLSIAMKELSDASGEIAASYREIVRMFRYKKPSKVYP